MMVDPYHAGLRDSQREWHVMNDAGGKEADDFLLFVTCATLMIGGELCLQQNIGSRSQAVILSMSSVFFSDKDITASVGWSSKCCDICLPSVASSSLSSQVHVQMYILRASSSTYCQTEQIYF